MFPENTSVVLQYKCLSKKEINPAALGIRNNSVLKPSRIFFNPMDHRKFENGRTPPSPFFKV